jgi:hypothetical protein
MHRVPSLLCIFVSFFSAASALELGIVSKASLDAGIEVRTVFRQNGMDLSFLYSRSARDAESMCIELAAPWFVFGPLSPFGLLRETENPLGPSFGKRVFTEVTGLRPDASFGSMGEFGLMIAPVPERAALFMMQSEVGAPRTGCFASIAGDSLPRLDVLYEMAEPGGSGPTDDWFFDGPRWPGGLVIHAAGKASCGSPVFSAAISGGVSGSELTPPGYFLHLYADAGSDELGADILLGRASREYRTLRGRVSRWESAAALGARISDAAYSILFRYSLFLGFAEAAQPYLPTLGKAVFSLERHFMENRPLGLRMRVTAAVDEGFDSDGRRTGRAEGSISLLSYIKGEESELKLLCTQKEIEVLTDIRLPVCGALVSLQCGLRSDEDAVAATALLGARFHPAFGSMTFKAGIEDMPLGPEIAASDVRVSVEWSVP